MIETATQQPKTAKASDPLACLLVFDRIEVGPPKVEPRRVTTTYSVVTGDQTVSNQLIYRYEEDVFDPNQPADVNLAALITAQVALNYGLFAKELVFHGPFDEQDREFLEMMTENTSREIYVKKFLHPNPFLTKAVTDLPAKVRPRYTAATLVFPNLDQQGPKANWQLWRTSRQKTCVLSSGGKDSLLSYGLLDELGYEVHPIFVNESGRHWFTALNTFRYMQKEVPETARVWTCADRIFNWMLRQMPFIKPSYADIRADIYPIRLYTVAVFLFGVLPLMKRRGLGRLVIGDEFDTSVQEKFKGIPHYDGLYDQSRFFDEVVSRFFLRKGFAISQFSILRPFSELLIQKTLTLRYPHLQQHQTSCHATHVSEERVLPCGKCEKCRRIVGMLTAVDADPRACGYDDAKIDACLKALETKGIHQEEDGARHLQYLLQQKGVLDLPKKRGSRLKPVAWVLKLRFDDQGAAFEDTPIDLRAAVYRLVMPYAEGAVVRQHRNWEEIDLLNHPRLKSPYPFELEPPEWMGPGLPSGHNYLWGELNWPQAAVRLKQVDVALLPVGAIEQHGPHLPLDVDAYDADFLSRRVAIACADPKPMVLPLLPYGVSYHHDAFSGTISISNESLSKLVYDIGMAAARNGVRKLLIINGHGGNAPALNYAAQMINRDAHILVCVDTGETSDVDIEALACTPNDVHAGEIETSTTLANRPHLVDGAAASRCIPFFSSRYLNFSAQRGVSWYAYTEAITRSGVMGDPTAADGEKGRLMWEVMIAHLTALVEDLKAMTLDELYQRRY